MTLVPDSGWIILDARQLSDGRQTQALQQICDRWPAAQRRHCVLLSDRDSPNFGDIPQLTGDAVAAKLLSSASWIGYVPLGAEVADLRLGRSPAHVQEPFLAPWLIPLPPPLFTATAANVPTYSWLASAQLVGAALPSLPKGSPWSLLAIARTLESQGIPFHWQLWADDDTAEDIDADMDATQESASVLVVIPHYQCEPWLRRCLTTMMQQTRRPNHIVVIDDGSPRPPFDILADFPTVTLFAAPQRVGPYRLIQQAIADTAYEYYCFQDADDWSSRDRLARLLTTAMQTNADLVGTQEIRIDPSGTLTPVSYPLDVNAALRDQPGHALLHPTSLVRRRLVMAVGGFATGLPFGGDTEFLLRAAWVGRLINDRHYAYFRQKRPDSLTTHAHTGLDSPARQALLTTLKARARANRAAAQSGMPLNLAPLVQAAPITLRHLAGPPLVSSRVSPVTPS